MLNIQISNQIQVNSNQIKGIIMLRNMDELDQIEILKVQRFRKVSKQKRNIIIQIRNYTHYRSQILAKIFAFWHQRKNKQKGKQKGKEKLFTVITEIPIISFASFVQLLHQKVDQQQFNTIITQIGKFKQRCKKFIEIDSSQYGQIPLITQNLDFAVFMTKDREFFIKAFVASYDLKLAFKKKKEQILMPKPLKIQNKTVKQQLLFKYSQKACFLNAFRQKQILQKIHKFYESPFFKCDEQVLQKQIKLNFPALRLKYYVPIKFQDSLTGKPLKGPIYSNSDIQCMYGHFSGFYSAASQAQMQGQPCPQFNCGILVQQFKENSLIMFLRDNFFNPKKETIMFKLVSNKGSIYYANYQHFRLNLRKITSKARQTIKIQHQIESHPMTFSLYGVNSPKYLIKDPARGKFCNHLTFCDLRQFYMTKDENNEYTCPICNQKMKDIDILYLKQAIVVLKFLQWKTQQNPCKILHSQIKINHQLRKASVRYEQTKQQKASVGKQARLKNCVVQAVIDQLYESLKDPYVKMDEYKLGIPNKKQQRAKRKYMFGILDEEASEGSDSDDWDDQQQRENQQDLDDY